MLYFFAFFSQNNFVDCANAPYATLTMRFVLFCDKGDGQ